MATSHYEPSVFLAVLRIFKDRIGAGSAWTVEEIWEALGEVDRRHDLALDFEFYRLGLGDYKTPQQWLTAALHSMADLGLVAIGDSPEESSGFPRWRIAESWRPPEPPRGGDGGGSNSGPTNDDGDDGDGGGGIRETLGHPVLFALPGEDFDDLVNALFDEVQQ
jgi:hypothetical protein